MNKGIKASLAGAAAAVFMVGASSPAFADVSILYNGSDRGQVDAGHRSGEINDNECDGHLSYQKVHTWAGNTFTYWSNACNDGVRYWGGLGSDVKEWALCEDLQGNKTSATAYDRCYWMWTP